MLNNGPNHLSDEDDGGGPCPYVQTKPPPPTVQWPRLMKPLPFLISTAAVINYVCPTPNTNIVIFWEGRGGSWFISLWLLKEWDEWPLIMVVCWDGKAAVARWRTWRRPAEGKLSLQGETSSLGLVLPSAGTTPRASRNLIRLSLHCDLQWHHFRKSTAI